MVGGVLRQGGWRVTVLLLAVALLVAACGGSTGGAGGGSAGGGSGQQNLADKLPDRIKQSKTIKVGSDISYPPVEFFKKGTQQVQGLDFDLADAMGKKLGVKVTFQNGTFDGLIPALKSKRFDILMSAMSDNAKRQKDVDFVDYFTVGTSILVKKGNPQNIQSLDDFCGKTIALQRGTTQQAVAEEQQKQCGARKIKILLFGTDTEAVLQVKNGRAVADMNDFPVAAYTAQQDPSFEVVGEQIQAGPYGIAVRKDDSQLRDALQAALQAIIDDGTYKQVLDKWQVAKGAVTKAEINGGQ
jgi:polar amino acid transport system substrate-binding protein